MKSDMRNGECLEDPMVEREFEAAEVLAGMLSSSTDAKSSEKKANKEESGEDMVEREEGDSNGTWGSKGKRSNKRVRSESPPVDSSVVGENDTNNRKSVVDQAAAMSDQDEIVPTEEEEEEEEEDRDAVMVEKNSELAGPSPMCHNSHVNVGRGRKNLSEAEKEARKLKRVMANRESARQTIRRRQALYEELRRKVAELMRENESLKKEKYSAIDEYKALQSSNKTLNDQVKRVLTAKLEQNHLRGKGAPQASNNSCFSAFPFPNFPRFMCKDVPLPYVWPSHVNLGCCGGTGGVILSPEKHGNNKQVVNHTCFNHSYDEREIPPFSFSGVEQSDGGPWCIMQCPWLMPLPTGNSTSPNLIQFLPTKDEQAEDNDSPTKDSTCMGESLPFGIRPDHLINLQNYGLFESTTFDVNKSCENVFGSLHSLHHDTAENHLEAALFSNDVQLSVSETKKTETAAMEARRRRKELMKLKNLQIRPSRQAEFSYN